MFYVALLARKPGSSPDCAFRCEPGQIPKPQAPYLNK